MNTTIHPHLPFASISFRSAVWSILTGIAVALPILYFVRLLPLPAVDPAVLEAAETRRIARIFFDPWSLALKALVIYPVLEEVFFRGLMQQMLRRYTPTWFAVLVTTSIFAITHIGGGFTSVVYAFVFGLGACWLTLRSRSLVPSILCHSAVNLSISFVLNPIFMARGLTSPNTLAEPFSLLFLAGSLAVATTGISILNREFKRRWPAAAVEMQPLSLARARA